MQLAISIVLIGVYVCGGLLLLTVILHSVSMFGKIGRTTADWLCRAPALDVVVSTMTWAPGVAAYFVAWLYLGVNGWWGVLAAVVGQLVALSLWVIAHEWVHREKVAGPRIVKVLNRTVGRWRNHAALWVTVIALPIFWFIRAGEVIVYPMLVWILNFPRYKQGEWVNCSRQKFEGLVGHDLIWCLYCDWMTGVYSLGGEMLRNVESFWCPIRFYNGKKCDNCKIDFPDINGGWVKENGTMQDVEQKMSEMYGSGRREWFGHPARGGGGTGRESAPVAVTVGGVAVGGLDVPGTPATPPEGTPPNSPPPGATGAT